MIRTDYLICPVCKAPLLAHNNSLKCMAVTGGKTHCFDVSSSGYCDLSHRSGGGGDPKQSVLDRTAFLDNGYYKQLANEICRLFNKYKTHSSLIADAGCGEGYYSEMLASSDSDSYVFGADLSKHAVHRASVRRRMRGGNNSFYAVASVFDLPVLSNSCDFALSMFAPIAESELIRILKSQGILIIGAAGGEHLLDLKRALYDTVYLNEARADLPVSMDLIETSRVSYRIELGSNADIRRLFGMTPYKFRTSKESFERLCALESLNVGVDVEFFVYRNIK